MGTYCELLSNVYYTGCRINKETFLKFLKALQTALNKYGIIDTDIGDFMW